MFDPEDVPSQKLLIFIERANAKQARARGRCHFGPCLAMPFVKPAYAPLRLRQLIALNPANKTAATQTIEGPAGVSNR